MSRCRVVLFIILSVFFFISPIFSYCSTGNGRSEPNQYPKLNPPNRPATSFLWITSPWKSFRYILWRNYKVCCCGRA